MTFRSWMTISAAWAVSGGWVMIRADDTSAAAPSRIDRPDNRNAPLKVVPFVDLKRYAGRWYEIARYPNSFQEGIVGVTARYRLRSDGKIAVINSGRKHSLRGPQERAEAVAWVDCRRTNAKWVVQFMWPFTADYWIIDLGDDYEYAVVGQPHRKRLWVLSRTPQISDALYTRICNGLVDQGYDPERLIRTPQPTH